MRHLPLALPLLALAPGLLRSALAGAPAAAPPQRVLPGALAAPTRVRQAIQEG
jgi:hypothetical protein